MNALEAVEIVYQHLKTSVLFTDLKKPNGELRRQQRRPGSAKEDVVVNSLTLNRKSIQKGVLNVNLYVPNLKLPDVNEAGQPYQDNSQPNTSRLLELTVLAEQALKEVWHHAGNYVFEVQQDYGPLTDTNNQHYQTIRVEFTNVNIT